MRDVEGAEGLTDEELDAIVDVEKRIRLAFARAGALFAAQVQTGTFRGVPHTTDFLNATVAYKELLGAEEPAEQLWTDACSTLGTEAYQGVWSFKEAEKRCYTASKSRENNDTGEALAGFYAGFGSYWKSLKKEEHPDWRW